MTLDGELIERAIPVWRDGHDASKSRSKYQHRGSHKGQNQPKGVTVDGMLADHGILFDADPMLWCAYEVAIRTAAKDRYGIQTNQRPQR